MLRAAARRRPEPDRVSGRASPRLSSSQGGGGCPGPPERRPLSHTWEGPRGGGDVLAARRLHRLPGAARRAATRPACLPACLSLSLCPSLRPSVRPRAARPGPGPAADERARRARQRARLPPTANTCAGAGGAGRRAVPPRCTYRRPPRPASPAAANPHPPPAPPPYAVCVGSAVSAAGRSAGSPRSILGSPM